MKKRDHKMKKYDLDYIRSEIAGNESVYKTPFGERCLFYADYTASGRCLGFVEQKMSEIAKSYANTHTTDDYTGETLTQLLHDAEKKIKKSVGATEEYKIIATGSGSTGALKRLQEILGIYIPPHTRERIFNSISALSCSGCEVMEKIKIDRPVVFIGPYEHHTNELMWREAFAEIVVVDLDENGEIDSEMFEREIKKEKYSNRVKYCSFSAGSNITGILTDTKRLAEIAHKNSAFIFFDFAAIAPYVKVNVSEEGLSYYDAIFYSPHKYLGGPGSSGILIFREELYRRDLPPTTAGGGTVDYVGFTDQDYTEDIETREKAGTPPIMQTIKAAFAEEVKEKIGVKNIEKIENRNKKLFFDRFRDHDKVEIIGNKDPDKRLPIISFNIKHQDRYLHPRFVTRLLSDLFGIQSRAGCSCAGPYGHRLLGITNDLSQKYRKMIIDAGITGVKPGWVRVNLHYVFTEKDILFLIRAIEFIAEYGDRFLKIYRFNPKTADWKHIDHIERHGTLSLDKNYDLGHSDPQKIEKYREQYFDYARSTAESLKIIDKKNFVKDEKNIEELKYFFYCLESKENEL